MHLDSKNIWYACEKHADIVLEDLVDTYEVPPVMDLSDTKHTEAKCKWCGGTPKYQFEIHLVKQEIT